MLGLSLNGEHCSWKKTTTCSCHFLLANWQYHCSSVHAPHSHWAVPLPTTKRLGPHIGGDKVAVSQSSRPTQEISQAVGHTGGRVAASLLRCCIAWSNAEGGKAVVHFIMRLQVNRKLHVKQKQLDIKENVKSCLQFYKAILTILPLLIIYLLSLCKSWII